MEPINRRKFLMNSGGAVACLGAVPLDLRGVYLATGSSGKALGSYAGVAMVFAAALVCGFLAWRLGRCAARHARPLSQA